MKKNDKINVLKAEMEAIEKVQHLLQKEYASKKRRLQNLRYGNADQVQFSMHWSLDGIVQGKHVEFERGVGAGVPPFDFFLQCCMIIEHYRHPGGTNLDYMIDRYAKAFKISPEEKARLMDKYWHKKKRTVAEIVASWTKFDREFFKSEEVFIKYMMSNALRGFETEPVEIKYGVLYFIFKYHEKGDFEELKKDIENVPERIRTLVDGLIEKR